MQNLVTYSDICISLNQKLYKREPNKCEFIQPDDIVQVMLIHEPIMPIHQNEATSQKDLQHFISSLTGRYLIKSLQEDVANRGTRLAKVVA